MVLVLLLKLFIGLVEFVQSLVEVDLEAVDFLAEIPDVAVGLREKGETPYCSGDPLQKEVEVALISGGSFHYR